MGRPYLSVRRTVPSGSMSRLVTPEMELVETALRDCPIPAAAPPRTGDPASAATVAPKTAASAQAVIPCIAPEPLRSTPDMCPATQPPAPNEMMPETINQTIAVVPRALPSVESPTGSAMDAPTPIPMSVRISWHPSAVTVPPAIALQISGRQNSTIPRGVASTPRSWPVIAASWVMFGPFWPPCGAPSEL